MQIQLRFSISQGNRDVELLKYLIQYLGCGKYYSHSSFDTGEFLVANFEDNINKIVPFFDKYSILGTKIKDFVRSDFKTIALLIQNKSHLNQKGLNQILKIKEGMNSNRKWN
jgi:hypothetical protein